MSVRQMASLEAPHIVRKLMEPQILPKLLEKCVPCRFYCAERSRFVQN